MPAADFHFEKRGVRWICTPADVPARELLRAEVAADAMWWSGGVVVDPAAVQLLIKTFAALGFTTTTEGVLG